MATRKKNGRKSTPEGTIKWDIKRRLEYIEFRVCWEGPLARKHLTEPFGISTVQASKDIKVYRELAPGNLVLNPSTKRYHATPDFKPVFISTEPQAYLGYLQSSKSGYLSVETSFPTIFPDNEVVPSPYRKILPDVLRSVLLAIRNNEDLEIKYQSLARPEPVWRWITPHALSFDGHRWHARAFCHMSKSFKDFLLSRILETGETKESQIDKNQDLAWHETVVMKIGPHPDLQPGPKKVIEFDYGMKRGVKEIPVKKAFLLYFYRNMDFHIKGKRPPHEQQVVLLNREEIEPLLPQ